MIDRNLIAWHRTQATACLTLAERVKGHERLSKMYREAAAHHRATANSIEMLAAVERQIEVAEADIRRKAEQDERDYWTRQQVPQEPIAKLDEVKPS